MSYIALLLKAKLLRDSIICGMSSKRITNERDGVTPREPLQEFICTILCQT